MNEDNITKKPTTANTNQQDVLFSEEEIYDIVKKFAFAFLSGDIDINFRNATEIVAEAKKDNKRMSWEEAGKEECLAKNQFVNYMMIAAGKMTATAEEQKEAVSQLYNTLLSCRAGHRIKGRFISGTNVEERLQNLEESFDMLNKLVVELAVTVKQWRPSPK